MNLLKKILPLNVFKISIVLAGMIVAVAFAAILSHHFSDSILKPADPHADYMLIKATHDVTLHEKEAEGINKLYITKGSGIDNLTELSSFSNLEELHIDKETQIKTLEGIDKLKTLKVFECNAVGVDLQALVEAELPEIQRIYIQGNRNEGTTSLDLQKLLSTKPEIIDLQIRDSQIAGKVMLNSCPKLEILSLSDNQVSSVSIDADQLKELYLSGNDISEINGRLNSIEILYIKDNRLHSIEPLLKYSKLKELYIDGNDITTINNISELTNLEALSLTKTVITDISELEQLPAFNSIYLNESFDRSKIDFMQNNFKNGDTYTKEYFLKKKDNLQ